MRIAAASVSMDAAQTYREVDRQVTGFETRGPAMAGMTPADTFGVRLGNLINQQTTINQYTQSVIEQTSRGITPDQNPVTIFNLETRSGRIAAQVAASGIFLTEDGRVRSLQEVDLATEERPLANRELAAEARFEESRKAVWAMRAIIDMQRFRLRLMLARRNVQRAGQQRMDRFDSLLDRMHERRELFLSGLTPKAMPEGESAETTRPLIS